MNSTIHPNSRSSAGVRRVVGSAAIVVIAGIGSAACGAAAAPDQVGHDAGAPHPRSAGPAAHGPVSADSAERQASASNPVPIPQRYKMSPGCGC